MSSSSTASLLQRRRNRVHASTPAASTDTPSSPFPSPITAPSTQGGISSPNPFSTTAHNQSLVLRQPMPIGQLKAIGEHHLKRIKLEPDSKHEFRNYLEASSDTERQCILLLHVLRSQDMHKQSVQQQASVWKPSSALSVRIKQMVRRLLLLPSVRYYSGTVETAVMAALRDSQVKDLPNEDSFDVDILKAVVARQFTTDKSELKKLIKDATDSADSDTRNIAVVANQALSRFCPQLKLSLAVFYCIAFIRRHIDKGHPNGKFWILLDDELEDINKDGPVAYVESMEICYEDDIAKYGDPATTKLKVAPDCLGDKPLKWVRALNSLGPNVQRVDTKKRKRARAATEDDDGDDLEDPDCDEGPSNTGTPPPTKDPTSPTPTPDD
ncbi:hypothetical protein DFH07DRAFT_949281 [Mycena maculata]|uniref:Uncharacterized protein n=1 Tax=Mycena maculata TaxID=230809 RepID=A0AAD7KDQ3_9AGAR|nr:hypothetical protein DFH07DRAFT_949281 [Mycena maculata]